MIRQIRCLLLALTLLVPTVALATAPLDDSRLFMDAFNAFQRKDYLFSIERLGLLNQQFPDSPLRDISLLMLARAHQRAGDYDPAARAINQFSGEFGSGTLAGSVDEELLSLGKRQKAGEKLGVNRPLQTAAQKIRNEQLAIERAAAEQAERERQARERLERERIEREKAEAERRERERLAAIKAARDAIRFALESPGEQTVAAGTRAAIPFELINNGLGTEEFSLQAVASTTSEAVILQGETPLRSVTLKPKERFKGIVRFNVPGDRVDGSQVSATITATSLKFSDLTQAHNAGATVAAPLVRVVSRPAKTPLAPGEKTVYRITLLNVGSLQAKDLDLKISLPPHLKMVESVDNGCWLDSDQVAACRIETLASGTMLDRNFQIVAGAEGQQRGNLELVQTVLQVKESFPGAVVAVKKP